MRFADLQSELAGAELMATKSGAVRGLLPHRALALLLANSMRQACLHPLAWLVLFTALTMSASALAQQNAESASPQESAKAAQAGASSELEKLKRENAKLKADKDKLKESLAGQKEKLSAAKEQAKEEVDKAKKEAEAKLKDALNKFKYIDISFGVLPNQDNQVNNYSKLQLNYSDHLATSLTYYSRNFSTNESKATVDTSPDASAYSDFKTTRDQAISTERTDINFEALKWSPAPYSVGGGRLKLSAGLGAYYIKETVKTAYSDKLTFTLLEKNHQVLIPANGNVEDQKQSVLPQLAGSLNLKIGEGFKFDMNGGYVFMAAEKLKREDRGNFQMPSLPAIGSSPASDSSYADYVFANGKNSRKQGYRIGFDLEAKRPAVFGLGVHFNYVELFGDTSTFEGVSVPDTSSPDAPSTPPISFATLASGLKQKRQIQKSEFFEEQATLQLGASLSMDFLAAYGVVPILRFNRNEDRLILTPKEGSKIDKTVRSYDMGVIFRY